MVPIDLTGKCALVTGGSQGIGRACGEWIARAGAAVALTARNAANLEAAVSGIRKEGGRAEAIPADLTAPGEAERVVGEAARRLGGLDILVNVAGLAHRVDPAELTDEDIDAAIDLKLRAAVRLTRAAIPRLRARGGGNIVFTGGLAHLQTNVTNSGGGMPNAALAVHKHQLARRLAPEGIRVNMLNPGVTLTPRFERQNRQLARISGESVEEIAARRLARVPLGRYGTPEDCAKVVLFLVSDLASFVTGATLAADGGSCDAIRY